MPLKRPFNRLRNAFPLLRYRFLCVHAIEMVCIRTSHTSRNPMICKAPAWLGLGGMTLAVDSQVPLAILIWPMLCERCVCECVCYFAGGAVCGVRGRMLGKRCVWACRCLQPSEGDTDDSVKWRYALRTIRLAGYGIWEAIRTIRLCCFCYFSPHWIALQEVCITFWKNVEPIQFSGKSAKRMIFSEFSGRMARRTREARGGPEGRAWGLPQWKCFAKLCVCAILQKT